MLEYIEDSAEIWIIGFKESTAVELSSFCA
jgi:hypothetical protein